jgi:hypothetical protein
VPDWTFARLDGARAWPPNRRNPFMPGTVPT